MRFSRQYTLCVFAAIGALVNGHFGEVLVILGLLQVVDAVQESAAQDEPARPTGARPTEEER